MQIHSQVKAGQKPHVRHSAPSPLCTGRCVQARKSHSLTQAGITTTSILPGRGRHSEELAHSTAKAPDGEWAQMIHHAQICEVLHNSSGSLPFFSHIIIMGDVLQQDREGLNTSTARLCTEQNAI